MKTTILALLALTGGLTLLAAPATAQQPHQDGMPPGASQRPLYPVISVEDLVLRRFAPTHTSVNRLHQTLQTFFGRTILVDSGNESQPNAVDNMTVFGQTLIFYDSAAQIERLLEAADELEQMALMEEAAETAERSIPSGFEVMKYSPRFISLSAIQSAMNPFARQIALMDGLGRGYVRDNMTVVRDQASLIVRDTPEHLAQIRELLERIDRPAPQVVLTAQLVQASVEPTLGALPKELVTNLSKLVGYEHFELAAASTLRTSVGPGREVHLKLEATNADYSLSIECAAYDEKTGALTIEEVRLERAASTVPPQTLFSTSCTISAGEYTVLGSSGRAPLFAVLRIVPVETAAGTR